MPKVEMDIFEVVELIKRSIELEKYDNAIGLCNDVLKSKPKKENENADSSNSTKS